MRVCASLSLFSPLSFLSLSLSISPLSCFSSPLSFLSLLLFDVHDDAAPDDDGKYTAAGEAGEAGG